MRSNYSPGDIIRSWNDDLLSVACDSLVEEILSCCEVNEGGMVDYRVSLCLSFFYKFFLFVQAKAGIRIISDDEKSALEVLKFHMLSLVLIIIFRCLSMYPPEVANSSKESHLLRQSGTQLVALSCTYQH